MNSNFNRQFILIDFKFLEDKEFLKFLGSSQFATYLVLRRHIWRSPSPHYMGLHEIYEKEKKLVCSLTRDKIAEATCIASDNISRHLSALEEKGIIQRVRTGRQNIYVLGEWLDVRNDGSYRVEWFYMEGIFGVSKSDLMESVRSDLTISSDQTCRSASDQTRRKASDNNIKENKEENTVNGSLKRLKDLEQPRAKTEYVVQHILNQLGDEHSLNFYRLVAAKVPEGVIYQALAEIKVDGARSPPKVFTYRMKQYALGHLEGGTGTEGKRKMRTVF